MRHKGPPGIYQLYVKTFKRNLAADLVILSYQMRNDYSWTPSSGIFLAWKFKPNPLKGIAHPVPCGPTLAVKSRSALDGVGEKAGLQIMAAPISSRPFRPRTKSKLKRSKSKSNKECSPSGWRVTVILSAAHHRATWVGVTTRHNSNGVILFDQATSNANWRKLARYSDTCQLETRLNLIIN